MRSSLAFKYTLSLCAALTVYSMSSPVSAQLLPANQVRIVKAFQTHVAGGKGLVSEITTLALENPANVAMICANAKQGPLPQQYAAAAGLRRAYDAANTSGNAELAATIQSEVASCGDASATAFAGGESGDDGASSGPRVAIYGASTLTAAPVSPAKP
jgi:hypothetical protein